MSRVELFERIRKDSRAEGLSIRALASRHGVHRRTVREALASATPPQRKVPVRVSPVLGPYTTLIRAWLVADRDVPRKQRHTARRVWQRLVAEYGAQVAESTVRAYVAQVHFELDNTLRIVTVPQTHGPGEEAEVDFGEFHAWVAGVFVRLWMFCMRLSHSGRGFHVAFSHQAQEAFFEGHVLAFTHFGAVPGRIRYDNLKAAVAKILFGRDRQENERFISLRSHYLLTELPAANTQVRRHIWDPPIGVDVLLNSRPHEHRARAFERSGHSGCPPGRPAGRYRGSLGALSPRRPGRVGGGGGVGVVR